MFRILRSAVFVCLTLALLASNILLLTSAAFNAAVSTAMAATLGVNTVTSVLSNKLSAQQKQLQNLQTRQIKRATAVRGFGKKLAARTQRVAARGIAAIPAESLPYVGAAVIVASVAYELYEACQTMQDLDTLYNELGVSGELSDDAINSICKPSDPGRYFPTP
jgi:hypothetical protein